MPLHLAKPRALIFLIPTDDISRSSLRLEGPAATAYRDRAGEGVFRLSVGLEDAEDPIADLKDALG